MLKFTSAKYVRHSYGILYSVFMNTLSKKIPSVLQNSPLDEDSQELKLVSSFLGLGYMLMHIHICVFQAHSSQ